MGRDRRLTLVRLDMSQTTPDIPLDKRLALPYVALAARKQCMGI